MSDHLLVEKAQVALSHLNEEAEVAIPEWVANMMNRCGADEPFRRRFVLAALQEIISQERIPDDPIEVSMPNLETLMEWLNGDNQRYQDIDEGIDKYGPAYSFEEALERGYEQEAVEISDIVYAMVWEESRRGNEEEKPLVEHAKLALDYLLRKRTGALPLWIHAMFAEARVGEHDPWRRDFAKMTLEAIVSEGNLSDETLEVTGESARTLVNWLASDTDRLHYVDEAIDKHGHRDSFLETLEMGYEEEANEVATVIRSRLKDEIGIERE